MLVAIKCKSIRQFPGEIWPWGLGARMQLLVLPELFRENNIVPLGYITEVESLLLIGRVNTVHVQFEQLLTDFNANILKKTSPF